MNMKYAAAIVLAALFAGAAQAQGRAEDEDRPERCVWTRGTDGVQPAAYRAAKGPAPILPPREQDIAEEEKDDDECDHLANGYLRALENAPRPR